MRCVLSPSVAVQLDFPPFVKEVELRLDAKLNLPRVNKNKKTKPLFGLRSSLLFRQRSSPLVGPQAACVRFLGTPYFGSTWLL